MQFSDSPFNFSKWQPVYCIVQTAKKSKKPGPYYRILLRCFIKPVIIGGVRRIILWRFQWLRLRHQLWLSALGLSRRLLWVEGRASLEATELLWIGSLLRDDVLGLANGLWNELKILTKKALIFLLGNCCDLRVRILFGHVVFIQSCIMAARWRLFASHLHDVTCYVHQSRHVSLLSRRWVFGINLSRGVGVFQSERKLAFHWWLLLYKSRICFQLRLKSIHLAFYAS